MRLAVFYSGGKDSTFAILKAREAGHHVVCAVSIHPISDESRLYHYPNSWLTRLQTESMGIPLIEASTLGLTDASESETATIAIDKAMAEHDIEGVVHGGIASEYQRRIFEHVCSRKRLALVSPLWHIDALDYMYDLMRRRFEILIVSVSAMGLDESWLGRILDDGAIHSLAKLSSKFGFNLTFEGGEAETLVLDCPLFSKRIEIGKSKKTWDGQRGMFEILEAELINKHV